MQGPDVGGVLLSLTIANFPLISSGSEASVMFDGVHAGLVFLRYSSREETALDIEAPAVPSNGLQSRDVQVTLKAFARPDRPLNLTYTVLKTTPKLKSAYPTESSFRGGTVVTCSINFFPFTAGSPDAVAIYFGDIEVPSESITVSQFSTLQTSTFTFSTPSSNVGVFQVRFSPKTCSSCDVSFNVEQFGDGPRLIKPLPVGGNFNPLPDARRVVRLSNWPSSSSLRVFFAGDSLQSNESTVVEITQDPETNIGTITFAPPSSSLAQVTRIDLTFVSASDTYVVPFPYQLYDPRAIRVASRQPATAPTQTRLYGSPFDLRIPVMLVVNNFPHGFARADLEIVFGEAAQAGVVAVLDAVSCSGVPCNQTIIEILAPSVDFPGDWTATIAANGQQLVDFNFTFFAPCQYDAFCLSLIHI
eukprot:772875-Rhodomonas_salina.1